MGWILRHCERNVAIQFILRHCERSVAIQCLRKRPNGSPRRKLLAMTGHLVIASEAWQSSACASAS
jgi:hypothetical protein